MACARAIVAQDANIGVCCYTHDILKPWLPCFGVRCQVMFVLLVFLVFLVLWLLLHGDTRLDERLATRAFQVRTVTPVLGSVQSHAGMFVFLVLWLLCVLKWLILLCVQGYNTSESLYEPLLNEYGIEAPMCLSLLVLQAGGML